ncbi:50S ribosomal protein L32e [Candidatus Pacearchaeota archaeon]|nr:50S ribosomal protein L32e [Candidatus Pacearchaeota archaeon]
MAKKKAPKFLRRNTTKYLRLGKRRKKLQKWTSPRGRDNKMRIMRKGYPAIVRVGYKNEITSRGLIEGKIPVVVRNVSELLQISDNNIAVIGRVGAKKRKEIAKAIKEKNIPVANLNVNKILAEKENKFEGENAK